MSRGKFWTEQEDNILKENFNKLKLKEISVLLQNRTYSAISHRSQKLGLVYNRKRNISQSYNHNFFSFPTIQNCYWAGFIAADGCIQKNGGVTIGIKSDDKILLEELSKQTNFNKDIKLKHNEVSISFWSAHQWQKDLLKHWNLNYCKSLTLKPPADYIKGDLALAYIIGYFDGDGTWCLTKNGSKMVPNFGFCGTEFFLLWIKSNLNKLDLCFDVLGRNLKEVKIHYHTRNNFPEIMWRGSRAIAIREKLKKIPISWRLGRKWEDSQYKRKDFVLKP